jgi:membrane associated rhomboid family serine protease
VLLPIGDEPRPEGFTPFVNWSLVLVNLIVYMLTMWHATPEQAGSLLRDWGFTPSSPEATTLLTSMFIHASAWHLIGNMLYLWIFGTNVEWCLGRVGYAAAYLATGLVGSLAFWAAAPELDIPVVGASGAISGVLGVYLIAFPQNRVRFVVFMGTVLVVRWPAWLVLAIWFVVQDLVPVVLSKGLEGGVAHVSHLAGFGAGAVIALALWRRTARASRRTGPKATRASWESWLPKQK